MLRSSTPSRSSDTCSQGGTSSALAFNSPLSRADRALYLVLVGTWLAANAWFWLWWADRSHINTVLGFVLNTLIIAADILEPGWLLFFAWRLRRPVLNRTDLPWPRVAAVTTKTPGEPLSVVGQTLLALKAMAGSHDTWLLDEGDDPATRAFCAAKGIRYFSRKDVTGYQQSHWPFQRRMKAGNYNSWLDYVGFDRLYDVIAQFDSDHRPNPDYLQQTVPVLVARPGVGYVAAPSICTGNRDESWVVLGRAEVEATFHGPLQAGFNEGYAPLIIGSHCTFRVSALREIGGFQTTWCEDHDNALALNASGYEGVFQPDALAVGDGPTSFAQAIQQEYQWARGLMQILLTSTPRWFPGLSFRNKVVFLFGQTWYPRLALVRLIGVLLPAVALASGTALVNVSYLEFIVRQMVVAVPLSGVAALLWRRGQTRPSDISFVSWRTPLFQMARWPWILLACGEAVLGKLLGRDFAIKVTAKGAKGRQPLPLAALWPYALIVAFSVVVAALFKSAAPAARGYALLALLTAGCYAALLVAVVYLHVRENTVLYSWRIAFRDNYRSLATATAAVALSAFVTSVYLAPNVATPLVALAQAQESASVILAAKAAATPEPAAVILSAEAAASVADTSVARDAAPGISPLGAVFPDGRVVTGAYDPESALSGYSLESELVFHFWQRDDPSGLGLEIDRVFARGRTPIVTVEPYAWETNGLVKANLLRDIAEGRYDSTIIAYARLVSAKHPSVIPIRFAHEMDLDGVHGWSQGDPAAYIAAYRHFVEVFRAAGATNVIWIWSPAGTNRADLYYPGDGYVDLVGVTVLASEAWDRDAGFAQVRSFETLLGEKYDLAARHDKPLLVAETAVSTSDPAASTRWVGAARQSFAKFPLLRGFVYFDALQPANTPFISTFPDWRLAEPGVLFGASGSRR